MNVHTFLTPMTRTAAKTSVLLEWVQSTKPLKVELRVVVNCGHVHL